MAAFDIAVPVTSLGSVMLAALSQVLVCGIGWVVLHALAPRLLSLRSAEGWGWSAFLGHAAWGVGCMVTSRAGVQWTPGLFGAMWLGIGVAVGLWRRGYGGGAATEARPSMWLGVAYVIGMTCGLMPVAVRLLGFTPHYLDEFLWWGYHMQGLWHAGSLAGQTELQTLAAYYPPLFPLGGLPAAYATGGLHPLYMKMHMVALMLGAAAAFPGAFRRLGYAPRSAYAWSAAAVLGAPIVLEFGGVLYADVPFAWWAGLGLAAVAVAARDDAHSGAWWRIAGVMFGACALTKYEGLAALAAAALLPFIALPRAEWRRACTNLWIPALAMVLLWYPWVVELQRAAPLRHTGGSPFVAWHWSLMLSGMAAGLAAFTQWSVFWVSTALLLIAARPWRTRSRIAYAVLFWWLVQWAAMVAMYVTAPDTDMEFYRLRILTTFPRLLIHLVPASVLLVALSLQPKMDGAIVEGPG